MRVGPPTRNDAGWAETRRLAQRTASRAAAPRTGAVAVPQLRALRRRAPERGRELRCRPRRLAIPLRMDARTPREHRAWLAHPVRVAARRLPDEARILAAELRRAHVPHL